MARTKRPIVIRHADAWIAKNQATFDLWIARAWPPRNRDGSGGTPAAVGAPPTFFLR